MSGGNFTRRQAILAVPGVAFAVGIVAQAALLMGPSPTPETALLVDVLSYLCPIMLAVVFGSMLALRIRTGVEHRFWALLVSASIPLLIAETYWSWYSFAVSPHGPPLLSWPAALYLLAASIFGLLIVQMTRFGQESLSARLRFYLDALSGMIVAFVMVFQFWTLPRLAGLPGGGVVAAAVAAIYPVVGGSMLLATLAVLLGWKLQRWRSWERMAAAAIAIFGAGLMTYPVWYPQLLKSPGPGPWWYTAVLSLGYYLLVFAIVDRLTGLAADESGEPWPMPRVGPGWLWQTYPIGIALALPLIGLMAFRTGSVPVFYSFVLLALVLALRSFVAALERARIRSDALTDPLTSAGNLRSLDVFLDSRVSDAQRTGGEVALAMVDVRGLAGVNLAEGHAAGDQVLATVADALRLEAPNGAYVARMADDDFAVVLPRLGALEGVDFARRAWHRARRLGAHGRLAQEVTIGVAVFPEHAGSVSELVAAASEAQQMARGAEGEAVALFDRESADACDAAMLLEKARIRSLRATVRTLAEAVDARDPATRDHSSNVAELATAAAQVLGLSDEEVQLIGLAALMHDVGKIGVRDEVLLKPGPLVADERIQVEEHAVLGERILAPAGLDDILPLVRHHHERWDGRGYPDRLAGHDIPIGARILAVCDTFETITAGRPYRPASETGAALEEIERCAGTQFDPQVALAFCRMVRRLQDPVRSVQQAEGPHSTSILAPEGSGA